MLNVTYYIGCALRKEIKKFAFLPVLVNRVFQEVNLNRQIPYYNVTDASYILSDYLVSIICNI